MTLTELMRHHYATGCYGRAHLMMHPKDLDALRSDVRDDKPDWPWMRGAGQILGDLMSIPVVVKDTEPEGTWRLVDNATKETIETGPVNE